MDKVEPSAASLATQRSGKTTAATAWPAAAASLTFSLLAVWCGDLAMRAYWIGPGRRRTNRALLDAADLRSLTDMYQTAAVLAHVAAALALIFAVWAARGRPRWVGWLAFVFGAIAAVAALRFKFA